MRVKLNWPRFAAVAIGYSIVFPRLHVVTNDQFHSMVTTVRQVRARGYRRLGLVIPRSGDERIDRGWSGGFLAQQQFWNPKERLPIFFSEEASPAGIGKWIEENRPDVIISSQTTLDPLKKTGYRVPEDIGFATYGIDILNDADQCSGIDENAANTGASAVDILVSMLHRGERGIPNIRQRILVEGTWRDGTTLRPRSALSTAR